MYARHKDRNGKRNGVSLCLCEFTTVTVLFLYKIIMLIVPSDVGSDEKDGKLSANSTAECTIAFANKLAATQPSIFQQRQTDRD